MHNDPRILLVEDEESLRDVIKMNLEMEGYEVEIAETGFKALKKIKDRSFNLYILDVMLPDMDGLSICQSIRLNDANTPILFLTAKDSSQDKIDGLRVGADDYLTKPFNLEELLLRVKILVKHSQRGKIKSLELEQFSFAGNEINFVTYKAINVHDKTIELSKKDVLLLKLLISRKDDVVSRQEILNTVWGYEVYPSTRTIDNFIMTFRKYFEVNPSNPVHFHSVRGIGYKFTP